MTEKRNSGLQDLNSRSQYTGTPLYSQRRPMGTLQAPAELLSIYLGARLLSFFSGASTSGVVNANALLY